MLASQGLSFLGCCGHVVRRCSGRETCTCRCSLPITNEEENPLCIAKTSPSGCMNTFLTAGTTLLNAVRV